MANEADIRKCVLTGVTKHKRQLLRFVVLRGGTVVPDFNKKLDGHGFYISNSRKLLEGLTVKNPLNKILHTNTIIAADLPQMVEQVLRKKALDAVNLARKSGDLVLGFDQVKECITKGKAAFVIEARDAGEDGKQKIAAIAKDLEQFIIYDIATLSRALNRENTVYMAVRTGTMANMVRSALLKYQIFMEE